jgi:putative flippase GtrA
MRFVRMLPERWQRFLREALKFGAVGGINSVVNYAVFNALVLTVFADGQLKANVVATIVATCTSYLMNRHWTYRDRPKSAIHRETILFFLFNATGLAIELGVLALAKYGLEFRSLLALNVAKTIGVALATIFRFWTYRTFVFRRSVPGADSPDHTVAPPPTATSTGGTDAPNQAATRRDGEELTALDPVAELAQTLDAELETELATELDVADLKATARPPVR